MGEEEVFCKKSKTNSITHARGKMMETMFYKRTDYASHENDSAVGVPSRFESYLASCLFIKKKKKRKYLNAISL